MPKLYGCESSTHELSPNCLSKHNSTQRLRVWVPYINYYQIVYHLFTSLLLPEQWWLSDRKGACFYLDRSFEKINNESLTIWTANFHILVLGVWISYMNYHQIVLWNTSQISILHFYHLNYQVYEFPTKTITKLFTNTHLNHQFFTLTT